MKQTNSESANGFQQQKKSQSPYNKSLTEQFLSLLQHFHMRFTSAFLFLLVLSLLLLFLLGCEKVIDIDLNESKPNLVIEANLSQNEGTLEVKISKTASYFNNQPMPKVENAVVTLGNGPGFLLQAEEAEPGLYKLEGIPANINSVYRLTVNADGQEYTGVSTLNPKVKIDSLSYEYQQAQFFIEGGYRIQLYFNDPKDVNNYYRVRLYRNGKRFDSLEDIILFDDNNLDGKTIQVRLRSLFFEPGDTVKVEMLSIDFNAWEYFSSLRDLVNLNPGSPSPANPVSNLSNGALGYFSAWTSSNKELVIPE